MHQILYMHQFMRKYMNWIKDRGKASIPGIRVSALINLGLG